MAASTDGVSYYRANQADGGTIEALYAFDDEELAEISKGHNNDAGKLRATIAGSGGGNIVLVPGPKGFVNFLHQGFATTTLSVFGRGMYFPGRKPGRTRRVHRFHVPSEVPSFERDRH
jgi:hypothetical protein